MAHAGGRPTKYDGENTIKLVDEYLDTCVDEIEIFEKTVGDKSTSYERILKTNIPSIAGLAIYLDLSKDTIYAWAREYPQFSYALEKVSRLQEHKLINGGMAGTYNSTMAKLMMSSNHGYKEKTESDLTTNGKDINQPILVKFVDDKTTDNH